MNTRAPRSILTWTVRMMMTTTCPTCRVGRARPGETECERCFNATADGYRHA